MFRRFERFFRFAGVGAIATAIHYTVLVLLVELAHAAPVVATCAGYTLGAIFGYLANHHWTFGGRLEHGMATVRYVTMLAFGFALNAAVVWLLHDAFGVWYVAAQVVSTGFGLFVNYAIASRWVYADRHGRGTG
jgi:putative flippase GtrA